MLYVNPLVLSLLDHSTNVLLARFFEKSDTVFINRNTNLIWRTPLHPLPPPQRWKDVLKDKFIMPLTIVIKWLCTVFFSIQKKNSNIMRSVRIFFSWIIGMGALPMNYYWILRYRWNQGGAQIYLNVYRIFWTKYCLQILKGATFNYSQYFIYGQGPNPGPPLISAEALSK